MHRNFWPKDRNGYLVDLSSWGNVDDRYKKVIEDVKDAYLENLPQKSVVSIYIIGSITTGKAKYGISDIDSFALVNVNDIDTKWIKKTSEKISDENKSVSKVGLKIVPVEDCLNLKDIFRAFLIRTQGLCIYGEDIKEKLPKFKPNHEFALPKVAKFYGYIDQGIDEITNATSTDEVKVLCRKYNKVILRTAGLLVMDDIKEYSNDVNTCAKVFLDKHPELRSGFDECIKFVENPIDNKTQLITHLKSMKESLKYHIDKFVNEYKI